MSDERSADLGERERLAKAMLGANLGYDAQMAPVMIDEIEAERLAEWLLAHRGEWRAAHNVVACINCKEPVTVTATNGVKCDGCRNAVPLSEFVAAAQSPASPERPTGAATPSDAAKVILCREMAKIGDLCFDWDKPPDGSYGNDDETRRYMLEDADRVLREIYAVDHPPTGAATPSDAAWKAGVEAALPQLPGEIRANVETAVEAALIAAWAVDHPPTGDLREQAAQVVREYCRAQGWDENYLHELEADIRALQPQPTGDAKR